MPMLIVDHHLKNFDDWIELFTGNPPPSIGNWRLMRGTDDPNRVCVVGEFAASETNDVRAFVDSEKMQGVFREVNAMSDQSMEFIWLDEASPH